MLIFRDVEFEVIAEHPSESYLGDIEIQLYWLVRGDSIHLFLTLCLMIA